VSLAQYPVVAVFRWDTCAFPVQIVLRFSTNWTNQKNLRFNKKRYLEYCWDAHIAEAIVKERRWITASNYVLDDDSTTFRCGCSVSFHGRWRSWKMVPFSVDDVDLVKRGPHSFDGVPRASLFMAVVKPPWAGKDRFVALDVLLPLCRTST
jgi:hypothetical protein